MSPLRAIIVGLKKLRVELTAVRYRRFLRLGRRFTFGRNTFFFARDVILIGDDVYVGRDCAIECDCILSDHVLIGNGVHIVGRHDHSIGEIGVTIRRATAVRDPHFSVPLKQRLVLVQRDVWVGCNATILSGLTIGECSVVAAGAVVTKSVPPNSIVAGNPARRIRQRFTEADLLEHRKTLDARGIATLRNPTEDLPPTAGEAHCS